MFSTLLFLISKLHFPHSVEHTNDNLMCDIIHNDYSLVKPAKSPTYNKVWKRTDMLVLCTLLKHKSLTTCKVHRKCDRMISILNRWFNYRVSTVLLCLQPSTALHTHIMWSYSTVNGLVILLWRFIHRRWIFCGFLSDNNTVYILFTDCFGQ